MITEAVPVPTIGIGAGPSCDGQVLVFHDLLGLEDRVLPKFVRRYASFESRRGGRHGRLRSDVRGHHFPNADESYHLAGEVARQLGDRGGPVVGLYGRA